METTPLTRNLHPLEIRLLRGVKPDDPITAESLKRDLGFNQGQSNQAFSWLESKELIRERSREKRMLIQLAEMGREYREKGSVEERLAELVRSDGPLSLPEIAARLKIEGKEAGSAFGVLSKEGLLSLDSEKRVFLKDERKRARIEALKALLGRFQTQETVELDQLPPSERVLAEELARKRGASKGVFRTMEREDVCYGLTPVGKKVRKLLEGEGRSGEEIGALTPELLKTGGWRGQTFRRYQIQVPPQRIPAGRKNPYVEFLEDLKDKLTSLGFEEYDGPLLETEFWNSDALFMPQFHSARDIHDVYHVKDPTHARSIEEPYLERVASTHERGWQTGSLGWRYPFDREFTRRMILRSHGTVLSARALTYARVPGRYFGVVRCFRYDRVDATHLADFYQTEGIALGEEVNLRTLLGLLKMFAEEVAGAQEVKYVPGYFPFTEPSVEVHVRHPDLGWFELGGSGIFRPEVTLPLGIKVPVLAWGIGIDRMALFALGLKDLRDLFTFDLEQVRLRRRQ